MLKATSGRCSTGEASQLCCRFTELAQNFQSPMSVQPANRLICRQTSAVCCSMRRSLRLFVVIKLSSPFVRLLPFVEPKGNLAEEVSCEGSTRTCSSGDIRSRDRFAGLLWPLSAQPLRRRDAHPSVKDFRTARIGRRYRPGSWKPVCSPPTGLR